VVWLELTVVVKYKRNDKRNDKLGESRQLSKTVSVVSKGGRRLTMLVEDRGKDGEAVQNYERSIKGCLSRR